MGSYLVLEYRINWLKFWVTSSNFMNIFMTSHVFSDSFELLLLWKKMHLVIKNLIKNTIYGSYIFFCKNSSNDWISVSRCFRVGNGELSRSIGLLSLELTALLIRLSRFTTLGLFLSFDSYALCLIFLSLDTLNLLFIQSMAPPDAARPFLFSPSLFWLEFCSAIFRCPFLELSKRDCNFSTRKSVAS